MTEFETFSIFDSIIIIESLPKNESQTGLILKRDTLLTQCNLNSTALSHVECNNRVHFFRFFEKLEDNLKLHDNSIIGGGAECPILHFEIHGAGDKSGLVLKNNEHINWFEFDECCRRINRITKNNLHVVLSVCNGYYSVSKAILSKLTPYYALIAPPIEISVAEIVTIFPHFYRKLFSSGELTEASEEVKQSCRLFHCESVLMEIMAHYFISHCEGDALELRVNSVLSKLLNKNSGTAQIPDKKKIYEALKPSEETFEKYKTEFLMSDFTENKDRFSLKYDDVLRYMEKIRA